MYFGINGEEKGLFFSGIDTRGSLWVLIDIYGNTTGIEFVGKKLKIDKLAILLTFYFSLAIFYVWNLNFKV